MSNDALKHESLEDLQLRDVEATSDAFCPTKDDDVSPSADGDSPIKQEGTQSTLSACFDFIKYLYSVPLLIFCVVLVMGAIFTEQTNMTSKGFSPVGAFFIFWFLIFWLAMMEGGQGALVGLQPIDESLYQTSHPKTYRSTKIVHQGDNMERFIVGRQFLVVLVVFASQLMSSATSDIELWGLPKIIIEIFLTSGVALIIVTIVLGQLTAQLNAAKCMLDFINNYFMLFLVTYASLAMEFSGILQSVYLVQYMFARIRGTPVETSEPPRNARQQVFFWGRVLFSVLVLGFAFAVTLSALFQGQTTMWKGVPDYVSVVIFFVLMCFVGMMEGMQIALFAVVNVPAEELAMQSATAHKNCQLTFEGQNLQAFLIGRQICVTICMFIIARITTLDVEVGVDPNIFGVSDGIQAFFNTGLLGAIITTIVASLAWRVVASSFPVAFLSNPLIGLIIRLCLLLEASGVCSSAWVLARHHKPLVNYQPDEVHLEDAEPHTAEPVTTRDHGIDRFVTIVAYTCSSVLLGFSVAITMALIFTKQTIIAESSHPAVAFILVWFLLIWLGMMEGGQGALVGLQGVDTELYKESHKVALKNVQIAHKGDNMQRFILGRQFLVVLVVFTSSLCANPLPDAKVFGLPDILTAIFVDSGLAVILMTVIIGQLTAQVNAANCKLDFINNYFMLYFVTYVSMIIEFSGLVHCVYLVQIFFAKITRTPVESNEPVRNVRQQIFFWGRALCSLGLLGFAFAVTLSAMFDGKTSSFDGLPASVSVIVFFVLMCVVGMMEGIQIALFAVVNLSEDELAHHRMVKAVCDLTFRGTNLQAFLIGRQIFVTLCMFVIARIITLNVDTGVDENIYGVSDGIQAFFNTGLLGALITTIVASLAWRIIASSFPVAFLSNPLIYLIVRLCLVVEASGICSAAWLLALIDKRVVGFQPDETYIGTKEERAASSKQADKTDCEAEAGNHSSDSDEGSA